MRRWEQRGERVEVAGNQIWFADLPPAQDIGRPPAVVLHGFPTCSYDWHATLDILGAERRLVLIDFLGFGLSDKPDVRYSIRSQADVVEGVIAHLGLDRVDLVTHDMGDSVGGELLARSLAGDLGFEVASRVISNGSIYLAMAHLTAGQKMLLDLPDARLEGFGADGPGTFLGGVAGTFAPGSEVDPAEMAILGEMALASSGLELLTRTIRYIEDRRAEESRYTGAIESHPSPLGVVWGALDPVAVHPMAERLVGRRPGTELVTLDDVGHYPMVEAPERFARAVVRLLDEGRARPVPTRLTEQDD